MAGDADVRVSLAHPHTLGPVLAADVLRRFAGAGLGGLECLYGAYGRREREDWLALARALLHDPSVLLLDEPFTGLDRKGTAALQETLSAARDEGRLLLVVTHDLEAIAAHTDHVVVLRRGKLAHEDRRAASRAA